MKKLILFFAAFSILFTSCQKSDEDLNPIDASKVKLLMDGYWKLTDYKVLPDVSDSTAFQMDLYTPIPGCEKDDFYKFVSPSIFTKYEGDSKCTVSAPDSVQFYYQLTENENHLIMWSNPDDREHSIIYDAQITYPSLKKFILVYRIYSENTELTSEHTKTFQKMD